MLYPGVELELFEQAKNWKKYFASFLIPYVKGNVLEVGAGIGATTKVLCNAKCKSWTCLEPDSNLSKVIQDKINKNLLPEICQVKTGVIESINDETQFDTVLYIDVMEHIKNDLDEIQKAYHKLKSGGHLIILVPAYQYLYSQFDKSLGHYRRYNKKSLQRLLLKEMRIEKMFHLDSVGVLLPLMNKVFLKQSTPTKAQINFWDQYVIRISKLTDKLMYHSMGRSLIVIVSKK